MFAGGASAGGHLSLMTALAGDRFIGAEELKDVKYSLRCAINLFGPTDLMILGRAALEKDPERAKISLKRLVGDCDDGPYEMSRLSPCSYVKCGALPPVLTVHGELDATIAREHHTELMRLYDAAGSHLEFIEVKHVGHVFKLIEGQPAPVPSKESLTKRILYFISCYLIDIII
jgi:acetyl esterase/lipase